MTMHLEVFDKKYLWEIETRQFFFSWTLWGHISVIEVLERSFIAITNKWKLA